MSSEYIFGIVQLRDRIQRERVAFGNRVGAIERGDDPATPEEVSYAQEYLERFVDLEEDISETVKDYIENHVMYPYITGVKGIGFALAAQMLCVIDIHKADTVSALWRYCGYGVVDGKGETYKKGEAAHFNGKLRTTLFNVATSFLRCSSPYRKFYDDAKEYYNANRDWTKAHIHLASIRKMNKMFLSHLWHVWREVEGLDTRKLYVVEKLGHKNIIPPDDFGWYDWLKD